MLPGSGNSQGASPFHTQFFNVFQGSLFMIWCDFKLSKRPQMEAQRHPKTYFSESSENSVFEQPSMVFAWFLCCRLMLCRWLFVENHYSKRSTRKSHSNSLFWPFWVFKWDPERAPKAIKNRTGHHLGTNMGAKVAQEPVWAPFLNILGPFLKHFGPLWPQISDPQASR